MGLGVGAEKNGDLSGVLDGAACKESPDLTGDELCLIALIGSAIEAGTGTLDVACPRGATAVQWGGKGVTERDDNTGRAVILIQWVDAGVGVDVGELEQEAGIGPSPGVDRLPGIANHGQVVVVVHDLAQESELDRTGILELVGQDEPVGVLEHTQRARLGLEQSLRQRQHAA